MPSRDVYLVRGGKLGADSGLRWEGLRMVNRKDRGQTYLLCSRNSLCEGKRERQRRRPGRKHVIYVPSWFSIVSSLRPNPVSGGSL